MASTIIDRISEKICGSPTALKIERELADEAVATRQALSAELRTLDAAELNALREIHEPAIQAARAAVQRCQVAHEAAIETLQAASAARMIAGYDASHQRDRLRVRLYETAPWPAIDRFIATLQELLEETNRSADCVQTPSVNGRLYTRWENQASVAKRRTALNQAIAEARNVLPYELLDAAGLQARCDALLAAVPPVEQRPRRFFEGAME